MHKEHNGSTSKHPNDDTQPHCSPESIKGSCNPQPLPSPPNTVLLVLAVFLLSSLSWNIAANKALLQLAGHHNDGHIPVPVPPPSEKMRFARLFCGLLFFTTKLHVRPLQKLVALKLAALVFFVSAGGPVIRLPPRDTTKEGVAGVQGQWKHFGHDDILGILEPDDSVVIML